ncbi:hypothetical protein CLF_109561 [Clonorchis sinensis]|uniref:Uncharacterized protein n=1 Tax=Clonorchis sinensis TaxID=79923 RepID=G7YJH8_CLOSI|nr:hypothetical protein CLF_109561 [Clonorchis sinensis]
MYKALGMEFNRISETKTFQFNCSIRTHQVSHCLLSTTLKQLSRGSRVFGTDRLYRTKLRTNISEELRCILALLFGQSLGCSYTYFLTICEWPAVIPERLDSESGDVRGSVELCSQVTRCVISKLFWLLNSSNAMSHKLIQCCTRYSPIEGFSSSGLTHFVTEHRCRIPMRFILLFRIDVHDDIVSIHSEILRFLR